MVGEQHTPCKLWSFGGLRKLCKEGHCKAALKAVSFFMDQQGACVSMDVFYWLLQGCINSKDLATGRETHFLIKKNGLESSAYLASHLIRLFVLFGNLPEAIDVFSRVTKPNVFVWSEIILGHARLGQGDQAIKLYHQMQQSNTKPDGHVFVAVLKACASTTSLTNGELVHVHINQAGLESNVFVGSSLVDMYSKCGSIEHALTVFDKLLERDVVAWNAIIAGYANHGHGHEALQTFEQMVKENFKPNDVTFVSVVKACSGMSSLEDGQLIHAYIIQNCSPFSLCVVNALIDMYGKCESIEDAHRIFSQMLKKDDFTWNTMITGCTWNVGHVQHGHVQEVQNRHVEVALQVFDQMQQELIEPDRITFVSILKACSSNAGLAKGKLIHAKIIESGHESSKLIGNSLIDMYVKCGTLKDACWVFDVLLEKTTTTWNAMILGYAQYGDYEEVRNCFENLQIEGFQPDSITYLRLLTACSKKGFVDEGFHHFKSMRGVQGLALTVDHYNCIVDLLGRVGRLKEADDLLQTTQFESNMVGWRTLLTHCKTHANVQLGRKCFDHVITMDCKDSAVYMLMSNIYAYAGMLEDAEKIEKLRMSVNAWKKPGQATIELSDKIHRLVVDDETHPHGNDIYAKLKTLEGRLLEQGCMPHAKL